MPSPQPPQPPDPSPPGLIQAFERWLAGQHAQGRLRHASSDAVYRAMWHALAAWCLGQRPPVPLRALDAATLQHYVASRQGMAGPLEPLTERYQWRLLSLVQRVQVDHALRQALPAQLAARELMRRQGATREVRGAGIDEPPNCLTDDEADRLQQGLSTRAPPVAPATAAGAAADAPRSRGRPRADDPRQWQWLRDRAAAGLQLGAGLGPGEVRALKLADVAVLPSRQPPLPWRLDVPASGSAPAHRVPVGGWAARLLARWLQRRADEGLLGPWLFPSSRSGKPWGKVAQFESVRRLLAEAGVAPDAPGGSFRLRHTFALRQLREGLPPDELARRLGVVDPLVIDRYQRLLATRQAHQTQPTHPAHPQTHTTDRTGQPPDAEAAVP